MGGFGKKVQRNMLPLDKPEPSKLAFVRFPRELFAMAEQRAKARGMIWSDYLRAVVEADCQRTAPLAESEFLALIQVANLFADKPQTDELVAVRDTLRRYIKANGAAWHS